MTSILYFEGAGMDFYSNIQTDFSDVGNFRIRTAFKNLDGEEIYLEMSSGARFDFSYKKPRKLTDFALYIDYVHKVEKGEKGDQVDIRIEYDKEKIKEYNYTIEDITKWINENLNCNFEGIGLLDRFYNYFVHAKNGGYNLIEDVEINHDLATVRRKAYIEIREKYAEIFNRKFPAISIKEMTENYIIFDNHQGKELLQRYGLPSRYEKVLL